MKRNRKRTSGRSGGAAGGEGRSKVVKRARTEGSKVGSNNNNNSNKEGAIKIVRAAKMTTATVGHSSTVVGEAGSKQDDVGCGDGVVVGASPGPVTRTRSQRARALVEDKKKLQLFHSTPVVMLKSLDNLKRRVPTSVRKLWFPPEIFEIILGYVDDRHDLRNCSLAVPMLGDLLENRKTTFLFDLVLPNFIKRLDGQSILNCRLVCKSWKDAVDLESEKLPTKRPYDNEFFIGQMKSRLNRIKQGHTQYSLFDPTVVLSNRNRELEAFEETYNSLDFLPRNPFFGRSVKFLMEVEPAENMEDISDQLDRFVVFLGKFGKHIWHLAIVTPPNANLVFPYLTYKMCADIISHLPNLRTYSINVKGVLHHNAEVARNLASDLVSLGSTQRCTALPHLQTLELCQSTDERYNILTRTLLPFYVKQVRKLTVPHWETRYECDLPHLKELTVCHISTTHRLKSLAKITAPIEKLILQFRYRKVNVSILNQVLTCFPVKCLDLQWPEIPERGVKSSYLSRTKPPQPDQLVPTLHTLQIANSTYIDYSFLRWFPNIQHLFLAEVVPRDENLVNAVPSDAQLRRSATDEDIQIHKYLYANTMNLSNVWDVFPKLKVLVFKREKETSSVEEENGDENVIVP